MESSGKNNKKGVWDVQEKNERKDDNIDHDVYEENKDQYTNSDAYVVV